MACTLCVACAGPAGAPLQTGSLPAVTVTAEPPTATRLPEIVPSATTTSTAQPEPSATSQPTVVSTPTTTITPTVAPPTAVAMLPTPTLAPLDEAARRARFDEVWQTVQDQYLYRDFRGLDWAAIRDDFRPQAVAASTPEEFYLVLKAMIDRLDDRHSRYLSPQEAQEQQAVTSGTGAAYVGIGTIEAGGVILGVFESSPAAQVGLRRRDRIMLVDGKPLGSRGATLEGPEGTSITLSVASPGMDLREVAVERRGIVTKLVPDAYRLQGTDVGYLAIQWFWSEDMGVQVALALSQLLDTGPLDGLIVDLRANRGGWRNVLQEILGSLMEGEAGAFFRADATYPLAIAPNDVYQRLRDVPLVVLVDDDTQSYAEVLAAALQAAGRAKVVGVQSPGNTETIIGHDFEDGSRLWLAQEGFQLPSGLNLEGRGVIPDAVVDVDWMTYGEMEDPQILKALELLAVD